MRIKSIFFVLRSTYFLGGEVFQERRNDQTLGKEERYFCQMLPLPVSLSRWLDFVLVQSFHLHSVSSR